MLDRTTKSNTHCVVRAKPGKHCCHVYHEGLTLEQVTHLISNSQLGRSWYHLRTRRDCHCKMATHKPASPVQVEAGGFDHAQLMTHCRCPQRKEVGSGGLRKHYLGRVFKYSSLAAVNPRHRLQEKTTASPRPALIRYSRKHCSSS